MLCRIRKHALTILNVKELLYSIEKCGVSTQTRSVFLYNSTLLEPGKLKDVSRIFSTI